MSFNKNSKIIGQHAFLSPSTHHWINYDDDKLRRVYFQKQDVKRGEELHKYAYDAIRLRMKQENNGTTVSMYINDAIGFRMEPEWPLYYSPDCFGTADACCCRDERWEDGSFLTLRISDLKTGVNEAEMMQLKIYAALFCLEYNFDPNDLRIVLRIYQNDKIQELIADPTDILWIMDRIITQSRIIQHLREED